MNSHDQSSSNMVDQLLDSVAKQRTKARNTLLKNLNPIISEYMKENKIGSYICFRTLKLNNNKSVNLKYYIGPRIVFILSYEIPIRISWTLNSSN